METNGQTHLSWRPVALPILVLRTGRLHCLESTCPIRFDNRIYIVDADQFHRAEFEDTETIIDHSVAADLIVLNKEDIASTEEKERITRLLEQSSPNPSIIRASHGNCSIEFADRGPGNTARGHFQRNVPTARVQHIMALKAGVAKHENCSTVPNSNSLSGRWLLSAIVPKDICVFATRQVNSTSFNWSETGLHWNRLIARKQTP